ncbi:MAG: hypothetical protein IJU65_06400 [Desulfovibrio sp.]|nr:hypothetical protein [Desulfovibrio sp.]
MNTHALNKGFARFRPTKKQLQTAVMRAETRAMPIIARKEALQKKYASPVDRSVAMMAERKEKNVILLLSDMSILVG